MGDHNTPCRVAERFGEILLKEERSAAPEDGIRKGAFFARYCTICHGMTETMLPDLYHSMVTVEARVEIPTALLSHARRPAPRMREVLGSRP